jgi:carbonic anhydrase
MVFFKEENLLPAPCSDLEKSVRDDVALLKASPVVAPGTPILGGIYDVKTGAVTILKD